MRSQSMYNTDVVDIRNPGGGFRALDVDLGSSENGLTEAVEDIQISIVCQPAGDYSLQLRITDAEFKDGGSNGSCPMPGSYFPHPPNFMITDWVRLPTPW